MTSCQDIKPNRAKSKTRVYIVCSMFIAASYILSSTTIAAEKISHPSSNKISAFEKNSTTTSPFNEQYSKRLLEMMTYYQLPSISIAINLGGKIVWAEAKGLADINQNIAATTHTQYAVGSIAKPMTSLAVARLVDQKKLSFDKTIDSYGDYKPHLSKLTVYQLASHTAGIVHHNKQREIREFEDVHDHFKTAEALDVFDSEELLFKPGTDFSYSSNGYILLSDVVGKAARNSFINIMKQEVFTPLNMVLTEHDTSTAGGDNEAIYYKGRGKEGLFIESQVSRDRSFLFGGGGYISTPSDLVRMAWGLQQDRYLSTKVKETLFTPVKLVQGKINKQNYALGWRVHHVPLAKLLRDTSSNRVVSDSLNNEELEATIKGIHHGGTVAGAASAYLLFFPQSRGSIAFTTNTIPKNETKNRNIRQEMWEILFDFQQKYTNATP